MTVAPATVVAIVDVELFKGSVHLCLFGFAAMCLGYNTTAFSQHPSRHHLINISVYGLVSWFEITQIARHIRPLVGTQHP